MSQNLTDLKKLLREYRGFAVRGPNQDLDAGELKTAARIQTAIINALAALQASKRIDDKVRKSILEVVKKSDITNASTADKLEAVIKLI